jgi:hypothetical protein
MLTTNQRRRADALVLAIGLLMLWNGGCGGRKAPAPANPERGRTMLKSALNAWKTGGTSASLQQQQPAIFMNDPDWEQGRKLLAYQMADSHDFHGSQLRVGVTLSLQDADGSKREKRITYLVDTHPNNVIVRGDT